MFHRNGVKRVQFLSITGGNRCARPRDITKAPPRTPLTGQRFLAMIGSKKTLFASGIRASTGITTCMWMKEDDAAGKPVFNLPHVRACGSCFEIRLPIISSNRPS